MGKSRLTYLSIKTGQSKETNEKEMGLVNMRVQIEAVQQGVKTTSNNNEIRIHKWETAETNNKPI